MATSHDEIASLVQTMRANHSDSGEFRGAAARLQVASADQMSTAQNDLAKSLSASTKVLAGATIALVIVTVVLVAITWLK